jgi:saccharopine dehydrogenase (NAD+, L-lysine-forming)
MRILILGGCGYSGATVASELVKKPEIEQIILADKLVDKSKFNTALSTSPKITLREFDIHDYATLVTLMKDKDAVVNCVGPFYNYGIEPMKAAIEAGTNYIDICDDADITQKAFTLDGAAKQAGVSICIGCGNSPGFSNAVIKYTADKLDEVDEIRILISVGLGGGFGPGVLYHIFHCLMDCNLQFINGELVKPIDWGQEEVNFFEPIGKTEVYYFGHPEPVTLPRYIRGVKTVEFKLGNLPAWTNEWFIKCIQLGFANLENIKSGEIPMPLRDIIVTGMSNSDYFDKEKNIYDTANRFFIVKGRKEDKDVTYTHHITGLPRGMTGITCSFLTQMLYRKEVKEKGVLAPEAFVNTESLLSFWKERGLSLRTTKTTTYNNPIRL